MTKDEALKLALELLERPDYEPLGFWPKRDAAVAAIKEVLAEPRVSMTAEAYIKELEPAYPEFAKILANLDDRVQALEHRAIP